MRRTGPEDAPAVLCLNGGIKRPAPGDWSTSVEWLVRRLAPGRPPLAFYEVRYRVRSWRHLDKCIEDARAALEVIDGRGGRPIAVLGYSMGGVSLAVAGHPSVRAFIGLAPWLPAEIGAEGLIGRWAAVVHGSIDGRPFGVSPAESRRGVERMRALGIAASYHLIRGATHAIALPGPGGRMIPLPRAGEWGRLVGAEVDRFQAGA
jgi:pimeloyl-ACP methyl ester carboxylesterase